MQYPIQFRFKVLALASQIYITDAQGGEIAYLKQKMFKLKEDIRLFSNDSQETPLYTIKADRILDFSAQYNFTDAKDQALGAIKRKGMRSIWRAAYEIHNANNELIFRIKEKSAWVKVLDSILSELPLLGLFTGYFLNPSYLIENRQGTLIAELTKQAAFFEGKFSLITHQIPAAEQEKPLILGALMVTLLERKRG